MYLLNQMIVDCGGARYSHVLTQSAIFNVLLRLSNSTNRFYFDRHFNALKEGVQFVVHGISMHVHGQLGTIFKLDSYLYKKFGLGDVCIQVVGFEVKLEGGGSVSQGIVRGC